MYNKHHRLYRWNPTNRLNHLQLPSSQLLTSHHELRHASGTEHYNEAEGNPHKHVTEGL